MKPGPGVGNAPKSTARFAGVDLREVGVAVVNRDTYDLTLGAYFLERWHTLVLRGVRELPDLDLLFSASSIRVFDESDAGRESGSVKLEIHGEAFAELYADALERR